MTNANLESEEIAKAMRRHMNAERVIECFKEPLKEIVDPLLNKGVMGGSVLVDVMMVLIFIHINLLGYLSSGSDETSSAVNFFRKYFSRVDTKYGEIGGLLYHSLRHGWIHRFTPKAFKLNDGTIFDFQYHYGRNREKHLIKVEIPEMQGMLGTKRLLISLPLLYEDVLSAMDYFAEDVSQNQELSDVFEEAFKTRRKPEEEEQLRKNYNRDLDFIYRLLNEGK